jgi:hypothetical protein
MAMREYALSRMTSGLVGIKEGIVKNRIFGPNGSLIAVYEGYNARATVVREHSGFPDC